MRGFESQAYFRPMVYKRCLVQSQVQARLAWLLMCNPNYSRGMRINVPHRCSPIE